MLHTIEVTQEDIDRGERGNLQSNPITIAMRRVVPGIDWVSTLTIWTDGGPILTPNEIRYFLNDYHCGQPVSPFSFEIEIPES